MKLGKILALCIVTVAFLESCKRENPVKNEPEPGEVKIDAKDIVTPASFNFETEKQLTIRVKVAATSFPGERFVIKIYADVPSTGALITTGITSPVTNDFSTTVNIPAWEEHIYIEKISADGSSEYQKVKASQFIAATFTGKPDDGTFIFPKSGSGMTCTTGCTSTSNNLSGNSTVNANNTVCYTGTINGSITVKKDGIAKICASGTISTLTLEDNAKVYILEGTVLTITNGNFNNKDNEFYTWSDSLIMNTGNINGKFYTYGKTYFNNTFNPNSATEIKNYGLLKVNSDVTLSKNVYNYDKFIVGGNFTVTSVTKYYNYCQTNVTGNFTNSNGDIYNYSYIKVGGTYTENSNGSHEMDNGALLSTKNLTVNGEITGTGTNRSKIKVSNTSIINSNGDIDGKIDYCDSNGIETLNGGINSPAAQSCSGYIAKSTCNPEGFGQPAIQDADSDGVPDGQDEYPNDANRAFNSYYPSAISTASLAFEDLWPTTGDYDYNDLVLAFNIHKVLNADNKVVDYKVKMKVKAIGASYDNGFGFRLDEIMPSAVASVTGQVITKSIITRSTNNTEASQDRAVIICYDSPEPTMQRVAGSMFNTIKTNGTGTSDTVRVDVTFASAIDDSKLSIDKFNPFIFTNQRRGYEVHLGNFEPTSLANTSLFGTERDRSVPSSGIYYKTANGMPWAILLPTDFAWPTERTAITTAYNYFDDWSVSGGANSTGWYTNNPGNRNTEHIY